MKAILSFITCTFLLVSFSNAQVKKQTPAPGDKPVVKVIGNYPTLKTSFGTKQGGNVTLTEVAALLEQSVNVKDEKGVVWKVKKFRFSWTTVDHFEDPETGEKKSHTNNLTRDIIGSSLNDPLFKQTLREDLKKGDKFIIDMIIVKGRDNLVLFAPALTFTVN